ncbi:MAG: hypothetical protein ACR2GN_08275 [Bacteroidia bacterium]
MKKILVIFILLFFSFQLFAQQRHRRSQRWKAYRYEFSFGLGVSNFLGELGGANQIGTNYLKDLELNQTRFAASAGLRFKLTEFFALKGNLTYGQVSGEDALTEEFFRSYRNLSFKSIILEANLNFEASFMREQFGHRYRLRGVRGKRGYEMYVYGFAGIGVFHFNPKAFYEGKWHKLQPLGTEGQGIVPSRKKYGLVQLCIPLGFGFKYTFDRRWGIGLEYGMRKTFTDYIDDVSRTYYDNELIAQANGPVAAALADRSLTEEYNGDFNFVTGAGEQRGDPRDKDAYMFAIISINYKILTGRDLRPRF